MSVIPLLRTGYVWRLAGNSRDLAERIPGAQLQAVEVFPVTIQPAAAQAAFFAQNR
jgi:hypothetical protein